MRFLSVLSVLSILVLIAACDLLAQPELHDVYVYGLENARFSYFYGTPGGLALEDRQVALTQPEAETEPGVDGLTVPGTLVVDDQPYLRLDLDSPDRAPVLVERIPLTTDLQLQAFGLVGAVLYFDGTRWFELAEEARAGTNVRVVPRASVGRLRGLGELTPREAGVLSDWLEAVGEPLVVAELLQAELPLRTIDGLAAYLRTGLFVQVGLATNEAAFRPPPETLQWDLLAEGAQAQSFEEPAYLLLADQGQFLDVWNRVFASQLAPPAVPPVDFERETILAVFLGVKPTGGYGLEVRSVGLEGDDVFIELAEREPGPGEITTQALTYPWAMLRILRGGIRVAWFRNAESGALEGVARRIER